MSVDTEPCPHCQGSGRRLVPPAPRQRGYQPGTHGRPGRTHGLEATYAAGCRCELCRAGRREAARRRKARK